MAEDKKTQDPKTPTNSPFHCACGREELLTPASPQPAIADSEEQRKQDERPGSQPPQTAITSEEKN
jgi:hypothetical protein